MKSMTVRGLDPELEKRLKKAAEQEGKSINQVVIETMRSRFGLGKEQKFSKIHRDLDHLFGRWSQDDFERVQGKVDSERVIDQELWR
jgi:ribosomal protein S24E